MKEDKPKKEAVWFEYVFEYVSKRSDYDNDWASLEWDYTHLFTKNSPEEKLKKERQNKLQALKNHQQILNQSITINN